MSISYVGSASAIANTVTVPAHVAGDYIVVSSIKTNNVPPAMANGFTLIKTGAARSVGLGVGYKVASSNSDTVGIWNTNLIMVSVYRGVTGIGDIDGANGIGNVVTFPALTIPTYNVSTNTGNGNTVNTLTSNSWVAASSVMWGDDIVTPAGFVRRQDLDGVREGGLFDTNATVLSFAATNASANGGNTAAIWRTVDYVLLG
jgi:hypothetical protein